MKDKLHPAALDEPRLLADCDVRRGRRSGPGGQHRNKVETAIVVTHLPSGIRAEATERRSQERNRQNAVSRLRVNLALEVRQIVNPKQPASDRWNSHCRGGRLALSVSHADFPALLAEALDRLASCDMDMAAAADALGITTSQFVKLLKLDPRGLQLLNRSRVDAGLRPLR